MNDKEKKFKNKEEKIKKKELNQQRREEKKHAKELKKKERLEKIPNEPRRNVWLDWIKIVISVATAVGAVGGVFYGVEKIINKNYNEQTQVVIEPRDGDIIVRDGDDYKLLQLIKQEDVVFPTKIQEVRINYSQSNSSKRCEINNIEKEDWTKRDSFVYVINNFSINPNKVINLLENISSIYVYCDFYEEKNISKKVDLGDKEFVYKMRKSVDENEFKVTISTFESPYEYVTKEFNNGFEVAKIRVEICYTINNKIIRDTITSDWIETDADMI